MDYQKHIFIHFIVPHFVPLPQFVYRLKWTLPTSRSYPCTINWWDNSWGKNGNLNAGLCKLVLLRLMMMHSLKHWAFYCIYCPDPETTNSLQTRLYWLESADEDSSLTSEFCILTWGDRSQRLWKKRLRFMLNCVSVVLFECQCLWSRAPAFSSRLHLIV